MSDNPTWSLPDDLDPAVANGMDVGLHALRKIYRHMHVDYEWSVCHARRFTWWMRNCAQCISVSEPALSNGVLISTLVATTTLVKEVAESSAAYEALSELNAHRATLSACVSKRNGLLVSVLFIMTTCSGCLSTLRSFQPCKLQTLKSSRRRSLRGLKDCRRTPSIRPQVPVRSTTIWPT